MSNLWMEQSIERGRDGIQHAYNPTLGMTYEFHPSFHLGLEYWLRGHLGESTGASTTSAVRARSATSSESFGCAQSSASTCDHASAIEVVPRVSFAR